MSTEAEYQAHKAWAIAGLVAFMMLINLMDKVVLGLVSVPMMDELKLTPAQFGLIGGSLHWLFAVSAVIGGFLANRYPARLMLDRKSTRLNSSHSDRSRMPSSA